MSKPTANILIIDDSESDTLLMTEAMKDAFLSNEVYTIHTAKNAIKFLNKEDEFEDYPRPDLILLDLKMPGLDGHEFLKIVKEDENLAHIPVIVLTSSNDKDDITQSYRLMANCYIVKPVNFKKFKQTVNVINDFWLGIARLPPQDTE